MRAHVRPQQSWLRLSSFGFGFRFSSFGFRFSSYGYRFPVFEIRVSVAGLKCRVQGLGIRVKVYRFRKSTSRTQSTCAVFLPYAYAWFVVYGLFFMTLDS